MQHWRRACLAVVAGLLVAACGGGASGGSSAPPPHNNVLFYATPGDPSSLDPGAGISGFDQYYTQALYDRLIRTDPKTMDPTVPELATSWSFTGSNKMTFRLNLRHGVNFQDGTPFNAEAVKANLEHYKSLGQWTDLAPVASETVVDNYTIDLNLKSPYSALPGVLTYRAGMMISPTAMQKYGKDIGHHPVGAGPFEFVSWNAGADIVLKKFNGYWDAKDVHFAGVHYKVIVDTTAMSNAAISGQIDFAQLLNLPTSQIAPLRSTSKLESPILKTLSPGIIRLADNAPPFDNVQVRRAANMAIDRKKLATAMVQNNGQGPAWQYLPPDYWAANQNLKDYQYNPSQAKQLLAQAGHPNGVNVQVCTFSTDTKEAATIESQQMAPAGFNLQISQEPVNSCLAKLNKGTVPMVQIGWFFQANAFQGYQRLLQNRPGNTTFPGVDDLMNKLSGAYTQQDQKPLYNQLNQLVFDQAPDIPTYWLVNPVAYTKQLNGLVTDRNGQVWFTKASFGSTSSSQ
jgi:ABC-type transport system substrate-binding protein